MNTRETIDVLRRLDELERRVTELEASATEPAISGADLTAAEIAAFTSPTSSGGPARRGPGRPRKDAPAA